MDKAPDAFRTISEVADEIDVPQHVLRFWESRFTQIRPMKRGGGRRYYRPDDVDLLRGVRHLLYGEGYTIRGVQRILREQARCSCRMSGAPAPSSRRGRPKTTRAARYAEETAEAAAEPNLSVLGVIPSRAPERPAAAAERREPVLMPPRQRAGAAPQCRGGAQT